VITRFPAETLLVAGARYWTVAGPLSATRDVQSNLNRASAPVPVARVVAGARTEGRATGVGP
jgi:hypothetical protein